MTKESQEDKILTKKDIADNDKTEFDWTTSVTTSDEGINNWEEVAYSRYEQWLAEHQIYENVITEEEYE